MPTNLQSRAQYLALAEFSQSMISSLCDYVDKRRDLPTAELKKHPGRDSKEILVKLAAASGEPGRWFAAAKDAGYLDLALEFANTGRTDPRTLSRASRDLLKKDARFCMEVGRLAIERILQGHGYELTAGDLIEAYCGGKTGGGWARPQRSARQRRKGTTKRGSVLRYSHPPLRPVISGH